MAEQSSINKSDYTILVVDDQLEVLNTQVPLLRLKGFKTLQAQSGMEALEIIKNEDVDILLLDYFMPGMSGEDVVKEVRKFDKEMIILLQTGYAGEKPPLEMLETLDIQGYHDKNEGPEKLLLWVTACVRSCLLIRENKKMFEVIGLANETIKSITENQELLIEKERLASLGQLIGGIAHNLKTPIMSISGAVEALDDLSKEYDESIEDKKVTPVDHHEMAKEMKEWVGKIKPYLSYMSEIITAVKDQAVNMNSSTNTRFSINELTKRVEILMKHELKYGYCKLNMKIDVNKETELSGEINNLVQVLNNLITNAIHSYDEKGGDIDIDISKQDNNIKIVIKDYGKGINKEVQDKLFKQMITTKGKNGTGLGLYMSHSTIKGKFKGNMWFESEEGKGTTFYIMIPLEGGKTVEDKADISDR